MQEEGDSTEAGSDQATTESRRKGERGGAWGNQLVRWLSVCCLPKWRKERTGGGWRKWGHSIDDFSPTVFASKLKIHAPWTVSVSVPVCVCVCADFHSKVGNIVSKSLAKVLQISFVLLATFTSLTTDAKVSALSLLTLFTFVRTKGRLSRRLTLCDWPKTVLVSRKSPDHSRLWPD